jgi:peptidoglycan/xylan/chitin deacetylase (PgdA/CDA1 family)
MATEPVRRLVVRQAARPNAGLATAWAYTRLRDHSYWSGARYHGGLVRSADPGVRILAYHAVDHVADPVTAPKAVTPEQFERHVTTLLDAGFRFIDAASLIAHLDGRPLPARSLVMTFDDAYAGVARHAAPVLRRLGVPAIICVVTAELGGHNSWTAGGRMPLLDVAQLAGLRDDGWEVASHSRTHPHLTTLSRESVTEELRGSRDDLARAGLGVPRLLAYPFGEHDRRIRVITQRAGYLAALAVAGSRPWPQTRDRFALPRFEVGRDTPADRLPELVLAGEPHRNARLARELRGLARLALDLGGGGQERGRTQGGSHDDAEPAREVVS